MTSKLENQIMFPICMGIAFLIGGYAIQKAGPYLNKIHNKLFHQNTAGWKVEYKTFNIYDDKCLDKMPSIEKFRSK